MYKPLKTQHELTTYNYIIIITHSGTVCYSTCIHPVCPLKIMFIDFVLISHNIMDKSHEADA